MTEQVGNRSNPIGRLLLVRAGEWRPVVVSFLYFFCLIGSYMMLRGVRETLAVRSGEQEWLFTGTFVFMLVLLPAFGWMVARFPRKIFLPACYGFFILNLLGFAWWSVAQPESVWVARAFFVWISTYNLFVVSVFWSLMVDYFSAEQGKRLFALIAAGGSAGGILGPLLAILAVGRIGIAGLMMIAAGLLVVCLGCQLWLLRDLVDSGRVDNPLGGSIWAGAKALLYSPYLRGMALLLLFLPFLQTMLYFIQAEMVAAAFESEKDRVKWFSAVDLGTQIVGWTLQLFITSRLLTRVGPAVTLMIIPVLTAVGFFLFAISPTILVLGVLQVVRRGGEYGLMKPARELLFTAVDNEAKYKAKNFIDTAVYRGGDMTSGWLYRGLSDVLGMGVTTVSMVAAPVAGVWAMVAWRMGRKFERQSDSIG